MIRPPIAVPNPTVPRIDDPRPLLPWLVRISGPDQDADADGIDVVPVDVVERGGDGSIRMRGRSVRFAAESVWTALPGAVPGWDVGLTVTLTAGAASGEALDDGAAPDATSRVAGALVVALRVPADGDPAWLVPAVFYGENRPAASRAAYPRWIPAPSTEGKPDPGAPVDPFAASSWDLRADRCAVPAVFASGGGLRACLATRETSDLGLSGVGFGAASATAADGGATRQHEIRLSFPYREAPVVYDGSETPLPPDVPTVRFEPGVPRTVRFRVHLASDVPHAATPILRSLRAWLAAESPLHPWTGAEDAASLAAEGLLRWHYRADDRVLIETAAFERRGDGGAIEPGDRLAMHVAWVSGLPAATALLRHGLRVGRSDIAAAGARVIDHAVENLAPCGTFWGQWTATGGWGKGWTPGPDALHARTIGEATLFLGRGLDLDERPAWSHAAVSNARFVVSRQREDGAIPSAWNGRTGEVLSWSGDAGLAWVAPLLDASRRFGDPAFAAAARRAGDFYAPDVEREFLAGAPEDVDLGPTSEDGYVAISAYVALAEASDEPGERARWLDLARHAADWTLSFRWAYNVRFPAGSVLADHDFRTRGADLASPANQHLHAYGLGCVDELLTLSRATGDGHYADRARETYACFRQFIARRDGDFGARRGMAPERFYQTRYDGEKGGIGPLSHAWCLGLLLFASEIAVARPELVDD